MKTTVFAKCCLSLILAAHQHVNALATPNNQPRTASILTGASGYVGRAVAHALLDQKESSVIVCLVRPARIEDEKAYWKHESCVSVQPYDMLDGGDSLRQALGQVPSDESAPHCMCVYHIASWFSPTEDHEQMAKNNVQGTEDLVRVLGEEVEANSDCNYKLVLTSSMAAVRGGSQEPLNGQYYTKDDWNDVSVLGENWGASYQWSKAESERRAWALAKEMNVPMVSLCPSFVFGPPSSGELSSSFSTELVGKWVKGESQVQSRLFVDIRDVAAAHVAAGTLPHAIGQRFILSTEKRVASKDIAEILQRICIASKFGEPEAITYDADFSGGAIPIGEKETEAEVRLKQELGITLTSPDKTIADMGEFLIKMFQR